MLGGIQSKPSRMHILLLTAMYPTSDNPAFGAFVRSQAKALSKAGVQVSLLVLKGRFRKLIYPWGVVQLHQRLAADSIDLIHAHFSYAGVVARMQWKVPVIVTYHGDDLLGSVGNTQGHLTYMSRFIVAVGQGLGRVIDAAIVQNTAMAQTLGQQVPVHIVPGEVDFELYSPVDKQAARSELGLHPDRKYLLFAANPKIPVKNAALAYRVVQDMKREDESVELVVLHKERQERLALYMNACDALLMTSFQEGSPTVVKQAMACNLPVVCTDVGDVREIIGSTDGCHICRRESADFVEKLLLVLRHPQRTQGRENIQHLTPHRLPQSTPF